MYYFEYDKEKYLYKYVESYNEKDDGFYKDYTMCYSFISGSTLTKFEDDGKFKNVVEYDVPVKYEHRFEAGESWLSVVRKDYQIELRDESGNEINDFIERNYPEGSASYEIDYKRKKEIIKYDKYPIINKQINLEDNIIYNMKFKIKDSLINNWSNIVDF